MTDEIFDGNLDLQNKPQPNGKTTIKLLGGKVGVAGIEAKGGAGFIGGNNSDGTFNFFPSSQIDPFQAIKVDPNKIIAISTVRILGRTGDIFLTGNTQPQMSYLDGICNLSPTILKFYKLIGSKQNTLKLNYASVYLDGNEGQLWIGGNQTSGTIFMFPKMDKDNTSYPLYIESNIKSPKKAPGDYATLSLNADNASVSIGGNGSNGNLRLYPEKGIIYDDVRLPFPTIEFNAKVGIDATGHIGGNEHSGKLHLYSKEGRMKGKAATITLDGEKGDINLQNADCAEEFEISELERDRPIESGTVMVLDDKGKLRTCSRAYDKRVAGVISGAGDCKPGIVLGKKQYSEENRLPLALAGKVNCKVNADYSPITVGDMLTTSNSTGYAMKVTNTSKAFGAVIGKALNDIKKGKGMIPILIALQ